jgi:hypothetical protein|tara:strand:+ start:2524 stop:3027 length:504 start_codon:yes stop_codon:yes gene_type:complete
MSNFARGKYSKAISDRSGMAFPYREMLFEWNGAFVHKTEWEPKHPQLVVRHLSGDLEGLRDSRPARVEPQVAIMLNNNPFQTSNSGSNVITVTEDNHNRTSGDRVSFRNCIQFDGISNLNLEDSAGYIITVIDTNSYSFVVSNNTATLGNQHGGGGLASAGPVTLAP